MSESKNGFNFQTMLILLVAAFLIYDIVTRNTQPAPTPDDVVVVSDEVKKIKQIIGPTNTAEQALVLHYAFSELSAIIEAETTNNTTSGQSLFNTVDNMGFYRSLTSGSNKELQKYVADTLKDMPKDAGKLNEATKQAYVGKFKEMAVNFKKAAE